MSYARHPLHIAVVALLLARGFGGQTVIIPKTASVIEHSPLQLDCFYMDYSTLPTTTTCRWSIAGNGTTIAQFYQNCLFVNIYEELYHFECTNNTANSMIIKSTDRNMHGTVFSCSYFVNGITASGNAAIRVSVPVSDVNLIQPETDVVIITENRIVTFTCNASASHPKPNITWYMDSHTPSDCNDDVDITTNINVLFDYDGYLYRVMSNLTFHPTRYDNGSRIYCNASNIEQQSITSTRKALLYVQYPPSTPVFFLQAIASVKNVFVIISNTLTIRCSSSGNPSPSYIWTMAQNKKVPGEDLTIENIKRTDNGTYRCMAYNAITIAGEIGNHNTSAAIEVTVLYPPDTPTFFYIDFENKHKISTLPLKVIEGDSVSVQCNATGNPIPTSLWMDNVADTDILSIVSVGINHSTNFICKSFNMMNDTFGVSRNGTSSNNCSMVVLHPPRNPVIQIQMQPDSTKEALNYTGILEGSDFRLYCHAVSNPPPSYKWTGPVTSSSAVLFVKHIQRNQSGPYICYVQNEMERSFGNTRTGRNNRSIFFNVLYKAAILYFGAVDFEDKNMMTVTQGEETYIMCRVESNPFSNTSIFFKGRLVNETIRSDIVTYTIVKSTCSDAGRYICKGRNEYNYEADASKDLSLFVKCLPQPSADQPLEKNVSAALSDSAVFRFHAAPYFDPGKTQFRWFKQGKDSRIWLRNGTKTYILSSDIHSVLRIIDVSEADYGIYLLLYNNSVGMNNFTFYLNQINQTVSVEIHRSNDRNYLPVVIGIVIAVLVIVGVTSGLVIYMRRRKQKTDSDNGNRSYENDFRMNAKTDGSDINRSPVYEGLKSVDERQYLEMKEQAYEILKPTGSSDTQDPVYTNFKL